MRCLVVVPCYGTWGRFYDFPLGLAYIAAYLQKEGHEVVGLNLNQDTDTVKEKAKDFDAVLTGGLITHFNQIKQILWEAKAAKPDIITVVGGGIISSEPTLMMDMLQPTYGVIGEAEKVIPKLFDQPGEGLLLGPEDPITDLAVPWPDYMSLGAELYLNLQKPNDAYYTAPEDKPRSLAIVSSRGCPYDCTFCFHTLGRGYRNRPLDDFFAEVDHLRTQLGVNILCILDEVLTVDPARLEAICNGLKEFNLHWMCQMRVDGVTSNLLMLMKESGCFYISYGIESASDKILKSMKKHTTRKQIDKALKLTKNAFIGIQGNILFADPAETEETMTETLDWVENNLHYGLNLAPLVPYPNSPLYRQYREKGLLEPKEFIKTGCTQPFPFCTTSDITPEANVCMTERIERLAKTIPIQTKAKSVKVHYSRYRQANMYTIYTQCLYCGKAIVYNNFLLGNFDFALVICRNCYSKQYIKSKELL